MYFTSLPVSLLSTPPIPSPHRIPMLPPRNPSRIHFSVSVSKRAGLPWVSPKHGISSCDRTKLLPSN